MKKFNTIFLMGLPLFFAIACKKTSSVCTDNSAPGVITNIQVQNLNGAAKLTYTLPDHPNLLYVKAVYETKAGVIREAKSSVYQNNILLEGYGDVQERDVKLYAVTRCEVSSEAVTTKVKPLPPAIEGVYNSMVITPTFGGVNDAYQNVTGANIVIGVLVKDSLNSWNHVDFHYSSQTANDFNVRGFIQNPPGQPQISYTFGIYVKDRWDNHTDTMVITLQPIYEELVDKTKMRDIRNLNYPIPQIAPLPASGGPVIHGLDYSGSYPLKNLFDGNVTTMFHTRERVDQPIWMPIDLDNTGVAKWKLSRFMIWQRLGTSYYFNHGNPHNWEIWGTNTPNVVSSWIKLGDWTMVKPSGRPAGDNSNEDVEVATAGQEYDFPAGLPAVRYIAWKNIDGWGNIGGYTGFLHMMELTLWGQKQ